jgi:hypothetical protein
VSEQISHQPHSGGAMADKRKRIYKSVDKNELDHWMNETQRPDEKLKDDGPLVEAFCSLLKDDVNADTAEAWNDLREAAFSTDPDRAIRARQRVVDMLDQGVKDIRLSASVYDNLMDENVDAVKIFEVVNKQEVNGTWAKFRAEVEEYKQENKGAKLSLRQVFWCKLIVLFRKLLLFAYCFVSLRNNLDDSAFFKVLMQVLPNYAVLALFKIFRGMRYCGIG